MTKESAGPSVWSATTGQLAGKAMRYRYRMTLATYSLNEDNFDTDSTDREMTPTYQTNQTFTEDWEQSTNSPANVRIYPEDASAYIYWDNVPASEDVAGYRIYSTTGGVFSPMIPSGPYYKVTGLNNGQTYSFAVRSVDGGELVLESSNSSTVTVTPESSVHVIIKGDRRTEPVYAEESWVTR